MTIHLPVQLLLMKLVVVVTVIVMVILGKEIAEPKFYNVSLVDHA